MKLQLLAKLFLLIFFLGIFSMTKGQSISETDRLDLRPLLFKDFLTANILKTDGGVITTLVNYNTSNQSIIFMDNHSYLELTGLEGIKEIKIGNDLFIPVKNKIYQKTDRDDLLISFSNKVKVNEVTATKKETGKRDSRITSNSVTSVYVNQNYKSPNDLVFTKIFWLRKDNHFFEISNLKKLGKAFNMDKKELASFIKKHKTNFNSYTDIIALLEFLGST